MRPSAIAGTCLALSLLTFFQFPGHSWLQQDSQIYAPILEHLSDPSVLGMDLLAGRAHVAYTLYDEITRAARLVTRLDFRDVLALEQIAARAFGIWGLYLIALAICRLVTRGAAGGVALPACQPAGPPPGAFAPNPPARKVEVRCSPEAAALFIAAICSLGAVVAGPSVLTLEYEPIPRAFALPLALCATGLTVNRRYPAAGIALAAAFLYHPPTALPFVAFYAALAVWPARSEGVRQRLWRLAPVAAAAALLLITAHVQQGAGEAQTFFARLSPELERLQRMRANYNWISDQNAWPLALLAHYGILFLVLLAAFWRLRREMSLELRCFALGLPMLGLLSLPASWLLLDHWRWALIPQVQPMRSILFVTLFAQLLCAAAGVRAALCGYAMEAIVWLALAYLPPVQPVLTQTWSFRGPTVAAGLAIFACLALRFAAGHWQAAAGYRRFAAPLVALAALAGFLAIPGIARVVNYPELLTPEIGELSIWARSSTPKDAVFLFADVGKGLDPGIFRAQALRAVYVDWKGGGQVNYFPGFAAEWWRRWQLTNQNRFRPRDLPKLAAAGIAYIVLPPKDRLKSRSPLFASARYLVYALP